MKKEIDLDKVIEDLKDFEREGLELLERGEHTEQVKAFYKWTMLILKQWAESGFNQ